MEKYFLQCYDINKQEKTYLKDVLIMPAEKITYDIDSSDTLAQRGEEMEGDNSLKNLKENICTMLERANYRELQITYNFLNSLIE